MTDSTALKQIVTARSMVRKVMARMGQMSLGGPLMFSNWRHFTDEIMNAGGYQMFRLLEGIDFRAAAGDPATLEQAIGAVAKALAMSTKQQQVVMTTARRFGEWADRFPKERADGLKQIFAFGRGCKANSQDLTAAYNALRQAQQYANGANGNEPQLGGNRRQGGKSAPKKAAPSRAEDAVMFAERFLQDVDFHAAYRANNSINYLQCINTVQAAWKNLDFARKSLKQGDFERARAAISAAHRKIAGMYEELKNAAADCRERGNTNGEREILGEIAPLGKAISALNKSVGYIAEDEFGNKATRPKGGGRKSPVAANSQRLSNLSNLMHSSRQMIGRAEIGLNNARLALFRAERVANFKPEVAEARQQVEQLSDRFRTMYDYVSVPARTGEALASASKLQRIARYADVSYRALTKLRTRVLSLNRDQHERTSDASDRINEAVHYIEQAQSDAYTGADYARRAINLAHQMGVLE